jgi:hypothetical protein
MKTLLIASVLAIAVMALPALAKTVPSELPDPDGKPGDANKPVKVYILAGQSNMVGFGRLSGAKPGYKAIYLTADPDAKQGPVSIYTVGNYKVVPFKIHDATRGFGITKETVEAASVIECSIEMPANGDYTIYPGYGDSTYNVATLDGKEVYRKDIGGTAASQTVALEAGKRYALEVTYSKGGSAALWLRQEDLKGNGDLELVTKRDKKFPWMIDEEGKWTVRKDVYFQNVREATKSQGSDLSATSNDGKHIGPEVPFGFVMGTFHDEQVLLIESSMGNRALNFDFRPPSSGRLDPDNKFEAFEYDAMIEGARKTLANIDKAVPGYKGQGYEIVGFVWWQGHKDAGQTKAQYEGHLVNMIRDVRKDLNAPNMKAVIATVSFGGYNLGEKYSEIHAAQMALGDPQQHPEFAGQVKSVDTRGYWRPADESPTGTGYHYNHNAETYMLVGDALGRAMVELLGGKAEPLGFGNRPAPAEKPVIELTEAAKAAAAKASQTALAPIIVDGMAQAFVDQTKPAITDEANGIQAKRRSMFLRAHMYGLNRILKSAGIDDYDWHAFGPDLANAKWDYHTFEPAEQMVKDKPGGRYREVTYPAGMENWAAVDFNAKAAGFKSGLPPFGQKAGKLEALGGCEGSPCGCGVTPRTVWDKEVILIRKTVDVPALKEGYRYRLVIGGSNHNKSGEGYAIYVNGTLLDQFGTGVPHRNGGKARGAHIYKAFRKAFNGGKVTIAVKSFLRFGINRGGPSPQGHITVWLQEQKIPELLK